MIAQRVLVIVILGNLFALIPCYAAVPATTQRLINKVNKDGPYLGLVIPNMFEMNPLLQHTSYKPTDLTIDFAGMLLLSTFIFSLIRLNTLIYIG